MSKRSRSPYHKIKAFLVEKEISYKHVAEIIHVAPNTVNKKINGFGGDFTLKEMKLLNQQLGIPIAYFFELEVPKKELVNFTIHRC